MVIMMLTALACTCGTLGRAAQGIQTAQAVATQAQGLATEIATTGALETLQSAGTVMATTGAVETLQSAATEIATAVGTQEGGLEGVPDDIPIYSDHTPIQFLQGAITYQAQTDMATLSTFYQDELPKNGWEQAEPPVVTDAAIILSYTKGDRNVTLNLVNAQTMTAVAIIITP